MKGDPKIIDLLNTILTHELTSVNQYWIHARMCENWGYQKLWEKIRAEAIDEMKHADLIVARILFLEGVPNLQRLNHIQVGESVLEQFKLDLAAEHGIIPQLNAGMLLCQQQKDHGTFELFQKILVAEEEHTDWLEAQLDLIKQVGYENYLTQQIRD
jgi:bacterioferritin